MPASSSISSTGLDGPQKTGCSAYRSLVVVDLDGTLLGSNHRCAERDVKTLERLGREGHCRAIATGRSLYSLKRVLGEDFPIDHIVFSSGAATLDCRTGGMTVGPSLGPEAIAEISSALTEWELDYAILHQIPESHLFTPFARPDPHPDFLRRHQHYVDFFRPHPPERACQFLAVTDAREELLHRIRRDLRAFKVIRATSPLDGRSMWLEVYPWGVSKAAACEQLRQALGIPRKRTFAIGNDFNDIDLLDWAANRALVANGPSSLRERYEVVPSNDENGFSEAVLRWSPQL